MNNCRHSIPSLPSQVRAEGSDLNDQALREWYPMNNAASTVLALIDGSRSIQEIARAIGTDDDWEDLIDPVLSLVNDLNAAYLVNTRRPRSFAELTCAATQLWTQVVFLRRLPIGDTRRRIDLTERQRASVAGGAAQLAKHSVGSVAPLLVTASLVLMLVAAATRNPAYLAVTLAFGASLAAVITVHELGHYVAFTRFEPEPRRFFLKSSLGSCGFVHSRLDGLPAAITTLAGPLAPFLCACVMATLPLAPTPVRILGVAIALSQLANLTIATSDGRQLVNQLAVRSMTRRRNVSGRIGVLRRYASAVGLVIGGSAAVLLWLATSALSNGLAEAALLVPAMALRQFGVNPTFHVSVALGMASMAVIGAFGNSRLPSGGQI